MLLGGKECRWFHIALAALTLIAAPPATAVTIDEFPIGATPTGIAAGPDGNLYVTTTAPSILQVSPEGAVTARYPITLAGAPEVSRPVFSGGVLWFALKRSELSFTYSLARRLPDGTIGEVLPPGTSAAAALVASAGGGNAWATVTPNSVSRVTASGEVGPPIPLPDAVRALDADASGTLWAVAAGKTWQITDGGSATASTAPGTIERVVSQPGAPNVWMLGRETLCCYGAPWVDFTYWLPPGSRGTRIGGGFLGSANAQDVAAGADGNAWVTDRPAYPIGGVRIGRISSTGRTTTFAEGLASDAILDKIVSGPRDTLWFTDRTGRVGRVRLDRPTVSTEEASNLGQNGASVATITTPRGTVTRVRFAYGTTTAYGQTTRWQDVGDGDDGIRRLARLDGLTAGTTYHYRAEITGSYGVIAGADRSFTTLPPPPPPPVPPADVDADGYQTAVDCDDRSARIYPGAPEVPGDRIDQDCDGADEPLQRFSPVIHANFHNAKDRRGRWSRATALAIVDLPVGATVTLSCRGAGCRFARWSTTTRQAINRLVVLPHLKGSKLRKGAILELRLTRAETIGTLVRWTAGGPAPKPVIRCLPPGAKKDKRC